MSALNAGIIGVGRRGRTHISTLMWLRDKFNLVALCDIDESRLKKVSENVKASLYTDIERMIRKESLDVCLIAVQAEGHHVVAKALAEKGVNILVETPIAITVRCADQMIKSAEKSDVVLEVSENVPRWINERLKQKIASLGLLGRIRRFHVSYVTGSYHGFAAIRSILKSEAETVLGSFSSIGPIPEKAKIRFNNGVDGSYEFDRDKGNYWEIIGTEGSLQGNQLHLFECDQRFVIQPTVKRVNGRTRITGAELKTKPKISIRDPLSEYLMTDFAEKEETWMSSYHLAINGHLLTQIDNMARAEAWMGLHDSVVNGTPSTYGAENAKRDIELLIAIRDSAFRDGAEVHLPLTDMTEYENKICESFFETYGVDIFEFGLGHLKTNYSLSQTLVELLYSPWTRTSANFVC